MAIDGMNALYGAESVMSRANYRANLRYRAMAPQQEMYNYGYSGPGYQENFSQVYTGTRISWRQNGFGGGSWCMQRANGYGIDMNRNGRFDRGRDSVLVFDTNRDGRYDDRDVRGTSDMMRAAAGDVDFNNDGYTSLGERIKGFFMRSQYQKLDRNRDGVLDTHEIARGGGKVWVDHSGGGSISGNELYSPFSIPNASGWGPSQRLDSVNPYLQTSHTSNNWGCYTQPSPWAPGGGYCYYGGGGLGY